MNAMLKLTIVGIVCALPMSETNAAIVAFDLQGTAGFGLLAGNETASIVGTPGRGGELLSGITFNDSNLQLTIDIGWGSGNGFVNLTGTATAGHIHGPTTSGGNASFTQTASPLFGLDGLPGWNPNATNGGFNGTITLTSTQAAELMAGRYYINIHTGLNSGGEIRGNLVVVPEPASIGMTAAALACLAARRRRVGVSGYSSLCPRADCH